MKPQVGIAGIRPGYTSRQVRALIGSPLRQSETLWATGRVKSVTWFYTGLTVEYVSTRGRSWVINVRTTSATATVPRGLSIGSTRAKLRAAYPGARCRPSGSNVVCSINSALVIRRGEGPITNFTIVNGRIRAIQVVDTRVWHRL